MRRRSGASHPASCGLRVKVRLWKKRESPEEEVVRTFSKSRLETSRAKSGILDKNKPPHELFGSWAALPPTHTQKAKTSYNKLASEDGRYNFYHHTWKRHRSPYLLLYT